MSGHSIILELRSGDDVRAKFACDEGDGAKCHVACERPECEEGCHCESDDREPQTKDWGECLIVTWLANDGPYWYESYDGDPTEPKSGPIEVNWSQTDETWLWSYAKEKTQ